MDVFEVGDFPLRMVTSLYGWKTSLLGVELYLGGVTPPQGLTGLPKKVGHHQREEFPNKEGGQQLQKQL